MRSLIVIGMFAATLTHAAWNGYTEERELGLDTEGVTRLGIDAGAGKLVVRGVDEDGRITVKATINLPGVDDEDAQEHIEKYLRLTLEKVRDEARLIADYKQQLRAWGDSPSVDLDVRMPRGIALSVDDGSGSIDISGLDSSVAIDDGSGSIRVDQVGSLVIDDGSGSITVTGVAGDVDIEDGSGSIDVKHVGGGVRIDDGSGGIDVADVEADLVIEDDGSGGLKASDVRGEVINET
jgi:hypothetical protein